MNWVRPPRHPGKVVEVGGQWIGPTQDHIAKLAKDLGVETFKTYNTGNYLFYENGKLTPYNGVVNPIPPDEAAGTDLVKVILHDERDGEDGPARGTVDAPGTPLIGTVRRSRRSSARRA